MLGSRNFAPSDDLLPYLRRHYVFEAELPQNFEIRDKLLSESAYVRAIVRGEWQSEIAPGELGSVGAKLLFGGNSRAVPVTVHGPFTVAGFGIRPSAWKALFREPATRLTDKTVSLSDLWGDIAEDMMNELCAAQSDEARVVALERAVRRQLNAVGRWRTDQQISQFEIIARQSSMMRIDEICQLLGLSSGQLERRVAATYGLTPKAVLRRSRFLELASTIRGMSSPDEAHLASLRFFDQSHMNREFKRFLGLTPKAFRTAHTPLFDAGLQLRVEGLTLT
jgi:AraC-like DNA-binding protein